MGHAKVPAEVPEDSRVLSARRLCTQLPIASTPGSSPLSQVTYRGQSDTGHNQRQVTKVRTRTSEKAEIDIQRALKSRQSTIGKVLLVNKGATQDVLLAQVNPTTGCALCCMLCVWCPLQHCA